MSWRTIGLLALACAAGIIVLSLDRDEAPGSAPVFSFTGERADELVVIRGADTTLVRKTGVPWQMLVPVVDVADEAAVGAILEQLQDVHAERTFSAEGDLALFGLKPPELELRVGRGDSLAVSFAVGGFNPAGTGRYAMAADSTQILVVPDRIFTRLAAAAGDLRSARLIQAQTDDIVAIRRTGSEPPLLLKKAEGGWEVRMPVMAKADDTAVRSLLRQLREPVAREFVLSARRAPAATWIVETFASAETLDVFMASGDQLLVHSSLRHDAMMVDSSVAAILSAPSDTWRSRELMPWSAYSVQALRFAAASGETLSLRQDSAGRWRVGDFGADAPGVMRLIRDLEAARVRFTYDSLDAWAPVLTIVAQGPDHDSVAIEIGPMRAEGRPVFADHLGGSALLASVVPDTLNLHERVWRSRRLVEANAYEIEALEVRVGDVSATATRRGFEGWKTSKRWAFGVSPDSVVAALLEVRIARFPEEIDAAEPTELARAHLTLNENGMSVILCASGSDSLLARIDGGLMVGIEADLLPVLRGGLTSP